MTGGRRSFARPALLVALAVAIGAALGLHGCASKPAPRLDLLTAQHRAAGRLRLEQIERRS